MLLILIYLLTGELFGHIYPVITKNAVQVKISCSMVTDKDGKQWTTAIYPPWTSGKDYNRCAYRNSNGDCHSDGACSGFQKFTKSCSVQECKVATVKVTINSNNRDGHSMYGDWKCICLSPNGSSTKQKALEIPTMGM